MDGEREPGLRVGWNYRPGQGAVPALTARGSQEAGQGQWFGQVSPKGRDVRGLVLSLEL